MELNPNNQQQIPQLQPRVISSSIQQRLQAYLQKTMNGDYLIKYNVHNSDKHPKFFKITSQFLQYATNDKTIKDQSKSGWYYFKDIKGIVFGKVSDVMIRPAYRKLEPFLCFSLYMEKRTLDLYATKDQIDAWFISLSILIKKFNKTGLAMRIGQYFWRKMFLKLYFYFIQPLIIAGKSVNLKSQFPRAIILFQKNNQLLPVLQ